MTRDQNMPIILTGKEIRQAAYRKAYLIAYRNKNRDKFRAYWRMRNKLFRKKPSSLLRQAQHRRNLGNVQRELICDYLAIHPCVDCGEMDIVVLEFDHIRGNKIMAVGHLIGKASTKRLEEEMAKCVVRCANCHRRKTAKEWSHYRTRYVGVCGHQGDQNSPAGLHPITV